MRKYMPIELRARAALADPRTPETWETWAQEYLTEHTSTARQAAAFWKDRT